MHIFSENSLHSRVVVSWVAQEVNRALFSQRFWACEWSKRRRRELCSQVAGEPSKMGGKVGEWWTSPRELPYSKTRVLWQISKECHDRWDLSKLTQLPSFGLLLLFKKTEHFPTTPETWSAALAFQPKSCTINRKISPKSLMEPSRSLVGSKAQRKEWNVGLSTV